MNTFKTKYRCVEIPGATLASAHAPTDLSKIASGNFNYDFQICRVECIYLSGVFSLRLNDLGSDPIPVPSAKEIVKNQLVDKLYFENTTTTATSKSTIIMLQGFEY